MKDKVFVELAGLKVEVKIVDERTRFGFNQKLIIPVAGSGDKWVNEESLLKPADLKVIGKVR